MIVAGIDPGKTGALVWCEIEDGRVRTVRGCRSEEAFVVGKEYALPAMRDALRTIYPGMVVVEAQQAMPATLRGRPLGSASTASIMRACGLWEGLLAGLEIPYRVVRPATWMRAMLAGAPGEGKERSIAVAGRLLPGLSLTPGRLRRPHSGLADAACLAIYGARELGAMR